MSGTSLDGVDIAYVKFTTNQSNWDFDIITAQTFSYSKEWLHKLKESFHYSKSKLDLIDTSYGTYLAKLINQFIKDNNIDEVDFIASHGHTIHHKPNEGYTLQIGDGQVIAKHTGIKTVFDFRTEDVALGGQGAPLVPIGDELLFSTYTYCLNLGGFANISFKDINNIRIAYDICAVNTVLNHYTNKMDVDYDDKGLIAKSGMINQSLLEELNRLDFYAQSFPKSLGIEYVKDILIPLIDNYSNEISEILRTFIEHIAIQITSNIDKKGELLITGGGAFNDFLISRIKHYSINKVVIPSKEIIDYKEALIFAFLGLLKINDEVNCLKSVTGASKNHSSGVVALV